MLNPGQSVEFGTKKRFKYVRPLGSGGTGDTHLFEDETTHMLFAIKKYAPKDLDCIDDHYERFVDEIKILYAISHPSIVRVYDYYLYPEAKTGYIQMEFIDGTSIDMFQPATSQGKQWYDVFMEVIVAFDYLEANRILHRDIRPANIMIDKDEKVKIIDFGFGKKLQSTELGGKSVLLNWPVTELPEETHLYGEYDHQSEIYFVGKLFQSLLGDTTKNSPLYHIIEKMIISNRSERYASFSDVLHAISAGILGAIDFSDDERNVFVSFADHLVNHIYHFKEEFQPIREINQVLSSLGAVIQESALEYYIQVNDKLIKCFVTCGFGYRPTTDIPVSDLREFYELLLRLSPRKQRIVLDNLCTRLSQIRVKVSYDDVPF